MRNRGGDYPGPRRAAGRGSQQGNGQGAGSDAKEDGVETENFFGFTHGSDTGQAGSVGISAEGLLALGKRMGTYRAIGMKLLELGVGATDDFSISMSALGACHRLHNVPDDDVGGRCALAGVSTEFRWRLQPQSRALRANASHRADFYAHR